MTTKRRRRRKEILLPLILVFDMAFSTISRAFLASRPTSLFLRCMSNVPENTVYGGPKVQSPNQRVTLTHLRQKHKKGEPITVVTAYDYPSAVHLDTAGIDICLVGDSAAMVVHGYDTTLPISVDEMLVHCRAVARGAKRPLLIGDLPFGSYESSSTQVCLPNRFEFNGVLWGILFSGYVFVWLLRKQRKRSAVSWSSLLAEI